MALTNKRRLFYLLGASIVALWLVMVALLIRKTHFREVDQVAGTPIQAELESVEPFQHDWMEIYLKGKKVGFSETKVSPLGEDQLVEEKMVLALNLMGQPSVMRMATRAVVDKGFLLKQFRMVIDSGVVRFSVSGKVEENRMVVKMGEGDQKKDHLIPLAGPLTIGAGILGFFKGRALGIGDEFRFTFFDPSILSHKEMLIKVTDKTVIPVNGREYPAFRLETKAWGQTLVFWLDEEGVLLKEEGFMGLTLVRSDKDRAPFDVDGSAGADFYDAAAIPVKQTLKRPREINYLKVKVAGLLDTGFNLAVLNEGRQKLKEDMLEILQESVPSSTPSKLSKADMEKRPVVSVPDALTVLETKVGDCNEHAVLLTAFLRAAGIPARECVGIVYTDHRFFYHAWTEAYLGHWISMDATLNQMPTDATHMARERPRPSK